MKNEIRVLRIRSLIANKEMLVEAARRDMAGWGEWTYHYDARNAIIDEEIQALLKEMESCEPEPKSGPQSVEPEAGTTIVKAGQERVMLLGRDEGPHAHRAGWAWLQEVTVYENKKDGSIMTLASVELDDGRTIEVLQEDVARPTYQAPG